MAHLPVQKGKKKNALKESVMEVGFTYYLILARMMDIDPRLLDCEYSSPFFSFFLLFFLGIDSVFDIHSRRPVTQNNKTKQNETEKSRR